MYPFPESWSYEEGAWIENFSVGYFGTWGNNGRVDAQDRVVITGAGPSPIGLSSWLWPRRLTNRPFAQPCQGGRRAERWSAAPNVGLN